MKLYTELLAAEHSEPAEKEVVDNYVRFVDQTMV